MRVVDEVEVDPATARVYAEGWQSWSPTAWFRPGDTSHRPEGPWQHTMRFRPGSALPGSGVQAEGLLVLDPGEGRPPRTYGTPCPSTVPTLRATLRGRTVIVQSDGDVVHGTGRAGPDGGLEALAAFGDRFAAAAGAAAPGPPPRVWCSWYRYFEHVTAADVGEALDALSAHDLPVDVVQVDDGWSAGTGRWHAPSSGVPDVRTLVDRIRSTGRRAGLWLAPFTVGRDTELARAHPGWLTGWAGRNWGQELAGLDLTHPEVREMLVRTLTWVTGLGVDYLKLDFLYAGAVPGRRSEDVDPVAAYRSGLELVRETVGPDVYLLGCGAPILPSVGLLDAMRVSPDTFHEGGQDGSAGLRGRPALEARWWQHGRFWVNDPDCLVLRPSYALREEWAGVVAAHGGLRSFSDRVVELDGWGLRTARDLLTSAPAPRPFPLPQGRISLRTSAPQEGGPG